MTTRSSSESSSRKQLAVVGGVVTLFAAAAVFFVLRGPQSKPIEIKVLPSSEAPELRTLSVRPMAKEDGDLALHLRSQQPSAPVETTHARSTVGAMGAAPEQDVKSAAEVADPYKALRELRDSGRLQELQQERENRRAAYLANVISLPKAQVEAESDTVTKSASGANPYDELRAQIAEGSANSDLTEEQVRERRHERFQQYIENAALSTGEPVSGDR